MKEDSHEFERRLSRQPLKQVPTEWRNEILAATHPAPRRTPRVVPWLAALRGAWTSLLWPHPRAWAGIGAVWVLILILNLSSRDASRATTAAQPAASTPDAMAEIKQQQKMFADLMGPPERQVADRRSAPAQKPRSHREETAEG